MKTLLLTAAAVTAIGTLAGCGGSNGTSAAPVIIPNTTDAAPRAAALTPSTLFSQSVEPDAVADFVHGEAARIVYVGFGHAALSTSKYGPLAFYAPTTGATAIVKVNVNAKVSFLNDDTTRHTASGLGTTGFPTDFDNTSGITQTGTAINASLTWSTGSLAPNQTSIAFSTPKKGTYYFGCYYHYHVSPSMRDVIVVSQPTATPTPKPTATPTATPAPTASPTSSPTASPTPTPAG